MNTADEHDDGLVARSGFLRDLYYGEEIGRHDVSTNPARGPQAVGGELVLDPLEGVIVAALSRG